MRTAFRWSLRGLVALVVLAVLMLSVEVWWSTGDTTLYASDFSEERFQRVERGMDIAQVFALLGEPLSTREEDAPERWCYGEAPLAATNSTFVASDVFHQLPCVLFSEGSLVIRTTGESMDAIRQGMTAGEVLEVLGEPTHRASTAAQTLHYTRPAGEGLFRGRIIALDEDGRVSEVISYQFHD